MSNQVEQIRDQIEGRFWGAGQPLYGEEVTEQARQLLDFIDALQKEEGPKKPYFDKEYIESKIKAFSEAHKGETAEQIEAECLGEETPIEVAGKKVVVRYARTQEEACASCAFCSRKECHDLDCNMRDIIGEGVCRYAYFVEAERQVPADVQEAADKYIGHPYEVAEGVEVSMRRDAYAAGMLAERERLMKEAPVAEVREMRGSTDDPFILTLAFRRIPNIEYHGGKVRVIIVEIKEDGK